MTSTGSVAQDMDDAAWGQLVEELGVGWQPGELGFAPARAHVGGYEIILEARPERQGKHPHPAFTRLCATLVNPRRFRFRVRRGQFPFFFRGESLKERVAPGEVGLDAEWAIEATDAARLRAILTDPGLRDVLQVTPRLLVQVLDKDGLTEASEGVNLDVLECAVDQVVTDMMLLRRMVALVTRLLPMLNAQPTSALEVPPAEVPSAFLRMLDEVAGSLGGDAERVGDSVETRVPDPLGLVDPARAVVDLPLWPRMVSAMLSFEAPLLPGEDRFTVDRKDELCFWARNTGDPLVDRALVLRGKPALRPALLAPLRAMADTTPRVEVGANRMVLRRSAVGAGQLAKLLGAAFDLWQELNRHRAGEGTR